MFVDAMGGLFGYSDCSVAGKKWTPVSLNMQAGTHLIQLN